MIVDTLANANHPEGRPFEAHTPGSLRRVPSQVRKLVIKVAA